MFNIKAELTGTTLSIALEGVLDTQAAPKLEELINEKIADATEVKFDLVNLEYLTSAGLRVLLTAQQEMEDKDGLMTLSNVNDEIMEIFDMTGFTDVLTIV
jgi:anti-sigma B factor antagonist